MQERLIAYFDLLGFRNLVRRGDIKAEAAIIKLLSSLAALVGDFHESSVQIGADRVETTIKPAVSAFSDHIVYSYAMDAVRRSIPFWVVGSLAMAAAAIAHDAMQIGCLLRGAITSGPLHHEDGIVFGEAMNTAYEMESSWASHPRIVVADTVAGLIGASEGVKNPVLFRDDDGLWCLDYMGAAFDQAQRGKTSDFVAHNREWIARVRQLCQLKIDQLKADDNPSGLQHWRWFLARFNRTIAARSPLITGETQISG